MGIMGGWSSKPAINMSSDGEIGYFIKGIPFPEEVLIILLSHVDHKTLLNCRQVCKLWRELVDGSVWKEKFRREGRSYHSFRAIASSRKLPWYAYYWIFHKDPFGRNLIKNGCGQNKFSHWTIHSNGGNKWDVERTPLGCEPVPSEVGADSCFVTSYQLCSKQQLVDLRVEGVPPQIMDELKPCITVSEWGEYAGRFDCSCVYEMHIKLLNSHRSPLEEYQQQKSMHAGENVDWRKISNTFNNYKNGVRYVLFHHGGVDSQFWAGHYGSKMTGARVELSLPPLS
uniref:Uncharacterized protein n=1 Tax=Timema shepardi TaxID=629360 RepID=A0A7R9AWE9_TIMSH|nr:unnamed protein product [Timema shepardi]